MVMADYRRTPAVGGNRAGEPPPEAVLEGLAVAGIVSVLRQLGDLAELAADVFHDLGEQVTAASARGRRLAARARRLEAGLPPLTGNTDDYYSGRFAGAQDEERRLHAAAPSTGRVEWHADLEVSNGVVTGGDTPRLIVEYIKRCRGPPRLSILDKYDAQGQGACLKKYTDPSFFRTDSACCSRLQQGNLEADGCLKTKETGPKFRSTAKPPSEKSALTDSNSEIDASEQVSLGFLSMLRQLKHRQVYGSIFVSSLKPQIQTNFQSESSAEGRASFADHSELDISFTSSPDFLMETGDITADASTTTEKSATNHQDSVQMKDSWLPYHSVAAGSDNGEQCSELGRASSFEAWLSPDAGFDPDQGTTEESPHENVIASHGALGDAKKAKKISVAAEVSCNCNKGGTTTTTMTTTKMSKYKGSVEKLASRVSKLFTKQQHEPVTGYSRNMAKNTKIPEPVQAAAPTDTDSVQSWPSDAGSPSFREQLFRRAGDVSSSPDRYRAYLPDCIGAGVGDSITSCNPGVIPKEVFVPVLSADPAFSVHDPVPDSEMYYLGHESSSLQSARDPSCDASVDEGIHHKQTGPSISNHFTISSRSRSPENSADPATAPESNILLFQSIQSSTCMTNGSMHKPTRVVLENSCSKDVKAVVHSLPPIPPKQWLTVKVRTGPNVPRRSFRKDHVQGSEGKILNTTDLSVLAVNSDEARSEPAGRNQQPGGGTHSEQELRQQFASGDSDSDMQFPDSQAERLSENYEDFFRNGTEISSGDGSTVSSSEVNKHGNPAQFDVQSSEACQINEGCSIGKQDGNVFFSAIEQLARISPPSVPRPKFSLLQVASHDRIMLRNGPSLIHPSRNLLDKEQLTDKSFSPKPVLGSSHLMGSPANSRALAILQRADDIRQAHADDDDVDSENSWSDSD
ncbi:hypothetical protein ACP4OV_007392 [Aristida adscensionis]